MTISIFCRIIFPLYRHTLLMHAAKACIRFSCLDSMSHISSSTPCIFYLLTLFCISNTTLRISVSAVINHLLIAATRPLVRWYSLSCRESCVEVLGLVKLETICCTSGVYYMYCSMCRLYILDGVTLWIRAYEAWYSHFEPASICPSTFLRTTTNRISALSLTRLV